MTERERADLRRRLNSLAVKRMPLAKPPPRESRFGSPLELSRVHWVRPKLVVEVTFLGWTADGLVRQYRDSAGISGTNETTAAMPLA